MGRVTVAISFDLFACCLAARAVRPRIIWRFDIQSVKQYIMLYVRITRGARNRFITIFTRTRKFKTKLN